MTNPDIRPSDEVIAQAWEEALLIDADWETRHQVNAAGFRAASKALEGATDPDEVLALTELKGEAFTRTLGSLALWGNKDKTLKERQAFEAEFGDQQ